MNGSRSGSDEEKISNDYNSFEKTNETPNYFKILMKSFEERNNNESKSNEDELEEKSYPIKKIGSSPNLSGIYSKKSLKENEDKSQEEEKGRLSCKSLFSSINELLNQKIFFEEEENESQDFNLIDMKELRKYIKMFFDCYFILKKENKNKKLNKKENIIQRKEGQIKECNSNIGKKFELENRINEQKFILDNLKESEEQKIKNDDLEKYNNNLGKEVSEQNIILSPSEKELKNALKKKEEKEAKNRIKNKNISIELKEKKKHQ